MLKRNFRSSVGTFTGKLTEKTMSFSGLINQLELSNKTHTEKLEVPEFMLEETRKLMKRGGGNKMMELARLLIVHEVALSRR